MPSDHRSKEKSTEGMVDYDENSSAQQSIISVQSSKLRDIAKRITKDGSVLRVADYGCGPGSSANAAVKPVLATWRARYPDAPLVACHVDQQGNDWNALFARINGPSGYNADIGNVRTEAAIGSFYNQMSDTASVNLATSFAACHWLSRSMPIHSPGTVWFADLEGSARNELASLARCDWQKFLHLRACELRSGGYLFITTLGSVPDASERNGAAASGRGIYRAIHEVADGMARDGVIDRRFLDEFLFSLWFMTAEEAREPLVSGGALASLFEVETIEVTPSPYNPADFFVNLLEDPTSYANAYKGYIRAFADSTLRAQLFSQSSTIGLAEDDVAHEFYCRLFRLYLERKSEFAFELWYLTVILRRV